MAKQSAPVRVPQLATDSLSTSPPTGRANEATAETMKRIEPSWLTITIHQPRSRLRQHQRRWQVSAIAICPEIEEEGAPDHVRRPDEAVLGARAQPLDERVDEEDAEDEGPDEQRRGAQPLEPLRFPRPPAPAVGQRAPRRRRPHAAR